MSFVRQNGGVPPLTPPLVIHTFCVILLLKYSCRQEYLVPPTGSPVPFSPLRNQPTAASLLPSSVQCGSKHLDARLSLFLS